MPDNQNGVIAMTMKKNDTAAEQEQVTSANPEEIQESQTSPIDQSELDNCKAALADWQSKYAHLAADFENYKKRVAKEQSSFAMHAQATLLSNLLSIIDDFDRAMAHEIDKNGIAMIHNELGEFVKKAGVTEMAYDLFDPERHEALMQVESPDHKEGQIVQVLEKGYMLGDRVLRPAKVSVAK